MCPAGWEAASFPKTSAFSDKLTSPPEIAWLPCASTNFRGGTRGVGQPGEPPGPAWPPRPRSCRRVSCFQAAGHMHLSRLSAWGCEHPGSGPGNLVLFAQLPNLILVFSKHSQAPGARARKKQIALLTLLTPRRLQGTQDVP